MLNRFQKKISMCGIAGIISRDINSRKMFVENMSNKLIHRGPDNKGIWENNIITLGHTRLSIIDLSVNGNQPMISSSGRYIIVFNGEIYNSKEIKKKIINNFNIIWQGHSDTEVLLNSIETLGIEETLKVCRGMFAFGIWDEKEKSLIIARDRIGEKPIYFGSDSNKFFFASELKALREIKNFEFSINSQAINSMLTLGYVPTPITIYNNVFKLKQGTYAIIKNINQIEFKTWWKINDNYKTEKKSGNYIEYQNYLEKLLDSSVNEQMISDVPYGSMLSGGIDSSLITAIMQKNSNDQIKTFTIGFQENDYNEAKHAKKIANYLNTDHHEFYIDNSDALKLIPNIADIYDEPFADSSQIPTILISNIISKNLSVCLTGDGGDELFGGYNRYIWAKKFWFIIKILPKSSRHILSKMLSLIGINNLNLVYRIINIIFLNIIKVNNSKSKINKIINILKSSNEKDLYFRLVTQLEHNVTNFPEYSSSNYKIVKDNIWSNKNIKFEEKLMYLDTKTYLPDDILVKVDRAAMANSLETRIPLLDKRIVEFSFSLPLEFKIKKNKGKIILRNILKKYINPRLIDRPKQGFGVPLDNWLRTSLKEWSEDMLFSNAKSENIFNKKEIEKIWYNHQNGFNNQYSLWNIIIFNAWLDKWH